MLPPIFPFSWHFIEHFIGMKKQLHCHFPPWEVGREMRVSLIPLKRSHPPIFSWSQDQMHVLFFWPFSDSHGWMQCNCNHVRNMWFQGPYASRVHDDSLICGLKSISVFKSCILSDHRVLHHLLFIIIINNNNCIITTMLCNESMHLRTLQVHQNFLPTSIPAIIVYQESSYTHARTQIVMRSCTTSLFIPKEKKRESICVR